MTEEELQAIEARATLQAIDYARLSDDQIMVCREDVPRLIAWIRATRLYTCPECGAEVEPSKVYACPERDYGVCKSCAISLRVASWPKPPVSASVVDIENPPKFEVKG